jgi:hypothetical protein
MSAVPLRAALYLRIPTKPDSDSENNPDGIPIVKPDSFALSRGSLLDNREVVFFVKRQVGSGIFF